MWRHMEEQKMSGKMVVLDILGGRGRRVKRYVVDIVKVGCMSFPTSWVRRQGPHKKQPHGIDSYTGW